MSLLITAFGSFGEFAVNPSSLLLQDLGGGELLPVTFDAVSNFTSGSAPAENILMLGVSGKASTVLLETTARNVIGPTPDAAGVVWGPGPIQPGGSPQLSATLWPSDVWLYEDWEASVDAGNYLCNFLMYRAISAWPNARIGFVHVPPFETLDRDLQASRLVRLVSLLEITRPASVGLASCEAP